MTHSSMTDADFTFDPESHIYRVDGRIIPGVTTILKGLTPDYDAFMSSAEARRRGKLVHALTAVMDGRGDLWPDDLKEEEEEDMAVAGYTDAWFKFKKDTGVSIDPDWIERPVHHESYGYAGTVDRVVQWGDRRVLIDIKTGSYHHTHELQLAGYRAAINAGPGDCGSSPICADEFVYRSAAVYLRRNGTYTLRSFDDDNKALTAFLAQLTLRNWTAEHERTIEAPEDDWVPLADDEEFRL